jgi:hypothetical protein
MVSKRPAPFADIGRVGRLKCDRRNYVSRADKLFLKIKIRAIKNDLPFTTRRCREKRHESLN